jgi:hypothetical protein
MKSALPGLAILIALQVGSTAARQPLQQQQGDSASIADAARRSREQKKEQPKAAKVWDNDTIPKKPGEVSVVGPAPAADANDDSAANAAGQPAAADSTTAAAPAAAPEAEKSDASKASAELAAIQTDLASAKNHLQTAKADLDILQRKFTLDSQTYYSKPNYAADKDGAASIEAEKADLEAKQQEVADAQMKVDQLEAKLAAVR